MADQLTFDVGSFLKDNGMEAIDALENGVYQVRSADGQIGTFDAKAFAKDQGVNPSAVSFQVNTPATARDVSPIGFMDRAKLSLGNAQGKMSYLKNKFNDVKYDAEKGIVVNNKGIWQTVDPSGLGQGDPREMTKELVKDVLDLGDLAVSAISAGVGAVKGAAAGSVAGPVGAAVGGLAGAATGGGVAEGLRTSLGRLVGTYQATPEEQLQDIGTEALLNLGGEALGLGAKASFGMLGKAFKNIGSQASEASKDILSETLGKLTGTGAQATRVMMDQTDSVIKELAQANTATKTVGEMADFLRNKQLKAAEEILDEAPKALTKEFGKLKATLVQEAATMPKVNVGELASDALSSIEEAGLLRRTVDGSGNTIFKVMDDETAITLRNQGKNAAILAPTVQKELQPIVNQFNKFSRLGDFEGSQAAATLMDLKKTINDVYRDLVGPTTSPTVKGLLDQLKTKFSQNIGQVFDQAGLTNQYMSTINIYQKYADSVNMARKMAMQDGGAENFVKKLVSDSGANRTFKDLAQDLSGLLGQKGSEKINSITTQEAAKAFSSWLPRTGIVSQGGLGAAAAIAPFTGGASLAVIPATSPRAVLNAVKYGQQGLKFIQSMNPAQRLQFLQDPELLQNFLRTTMTAAANEEIQTEQLTQQAKQAAGVQ